MACAPRVAIHFWCVPYNNMIFQHGLCVHEYNSHMALTKSHGDSVAARHEGDLVVACHTTNSMVA